MKLLPLWLVTALLHGYIAARTISGLQASAGGQWLLLGALALSALLIPPALFGLRRDPTARARQLMHGVRWAGLLFLGLFSSLLVLTLARDALLVVLWLVNGLVPGWLLLAPWRTVSAQAVLLLGLAVTLLGFWNARRTAVVRRVDVPIKGLPAAWHGFTVAQISDVHVGPTIGRGYLQRIVSRVNALQADLVAITGDLVDGRVSELAAQVAPLAGLSSRHGTFFVTGNHEYYSGAHAWIDELRRLGLTVLINQHVVLSSPSVPGQVSAQLVLAGVTDYSAGHFDAAHASDPAAALLGAPLDAVRLLLAHQPRSAVAAAEAGFDLQLSGHTHGGQFYPWNLLVRMQQPFTAGLHKLQDLWVYTSRGTGYWGPPKRFGAPSEITLLRLVLV
ncbi:metallophosphoesterase [Polaromonas sp.]|uniref:metallophosphoesterase n=1 Tax=Polaromonas sp. TaxID=1869339 RepID=UPI0017AE420E|nr:metallophosphoesterase [Polaromonas sp.]NMM07935.1 metallophosphoesterase [Polaromonas sp.]